MVDGSAGNVFIFPPLAESYIQSREWATDVFRSQDGTEVRETKFYTTSKPVRKLKFSLIAISQNERTRIENLLRYAVKSTIFAPLWFDLTYLTQDSDASTSVWCDTTESEFTTSGYVLVLNRQTYEGEIRIISTINADRLICSTTIAGFTIGDYVLPLIIVTSKSDNFISNIIETTGKVNVELTEIR